MPSESSLYWKALIAIWLGVLMFSLKQPAETFISEKVASMPLTSTLRGFPSVTVCPYFRNVRPDVDGELYEFFHGYLTAGRGSHMRYLSVSRSHMPPLMTYQPLVNETVVKQIMVAHNGSLERVLREMALDTASLFPWTSVRPDHLRFGVNELFTVYGLCYVFSVKDPMSELLLPQVSLSIRMLEGYEQAVTRSHIPAKYRLSLGDAADNAVVPPFHGEVRVNSYDKLEITVVTRSMSLYKGKWHSFCQNVTAGDYYHLGLRFISDNYCTHCKEYVPASPAYAEVKSERYCNAFLGEACIYKAVFDTRFLEYAARMTPRPCFERFYDLSIKRRKGNLSDPTVTVRVGEMSRFDMTKESPIMSIPDFLASLGGSLGIFFGLSVAAVAKLVIMAVTAGRKLGWKAVRRVKRVWKRRLKNRRKGRRSSGVVSLHLR